MIKIKKIHLKCWQKHSDLILDFNSDINTITGLTDTGKSCIFRAIEWVFGFSTIVENDYRQENTKETSVKVWLNSEFQVERIRSNTLNRYILFKNNYKNKIFDNFGRFPPEEIQQILEISTIDINNENINLNFANQDQLNFLLDSNYSDTLKAKILNKFTGNELLDKLFKKCNTENLKFNKDIKETEENIEEQEEQLDDYSLNYKNLKKKLNNIQEIYKKLKEDVEIYEHLKDLSDKLKVNKEEEEFVKFKISQIKIVSDNKIKNLKEDAEQLNKLSELFYQLEATNESLENLKKKRSKIKTVDVDFNKLVILNQSIQKLEQLKDSLDLNSEQMVKVEEKLKHQRIILKETEKELKDIWDKSPICPLCGK